MPKIHESFKVIKPTNTLGRFGSTTYISRMPRISYICDAISKQCKFSVVGASS